VVGEGRHPLLVRSLKRIVKANKRNNSNLQKAEGDWKMKTRALLILVITSVLCIPSFLNAENSETIKETVVQLSDNIYRVSLDYSLRPNIGVSTGPDGVLLVDTGHREVAPKLLEALQKIDKGDIKYIINTHHHNDHVGGNGICGKNAIIIGADDLVQLESDGVLTPGKGSLTGKTGKSFKKYFTMHFNGDEIQIIPSPGAHSRSDLIIYFKNSGVVHMGDLLLIQFFPAVGARVKEYLNILDKVIDFFPEDTKFIGGHGRDYTLDDLKDYKQMLFTTIDIVRQGMKAGKNIEDMQKEKALKEYESWGIFLEFLNPDTWIESIYKSYQ